MMEYLRNQLVQRIGLGIVAIIVVVGLINFFQIRPPAAFPQRGVIVVANGKNLSEIAAELKQKHIIRSSFWFTNFVIMLNRERKVVGGEYYFEKPLSVYGVAKRLTQGQFHMEQLKTTIPEGSTIFDISDILNKNYPDFDSSHFYDLAKSKEGYLFPDTYYFGADVKPEKVVAMMTTTFDKKIRQDTVQAAIKTFGKPLSDVLIMASILEGEARQMRTRQIIAGILWERLRLKIPLQVDAAFRYVNGKTSSELTLSDLKIDSPYNTYIHTGFPPTPISNPGIDSIMAAVTPIKTDYLYFLTDKDGNMHYARTLDEHAANKAKYLK